MELAGPCIPGLGREEPLASAVGPHGVAVIGLLGDIVVPVARGTAGPPAAAAGPLGLPGVTTASVAARPAGACLEAREPCTLAIDVLRSSPPVITVFGTYTVL
jgi:hypothetical protein